MNPDLDNLYSDDYINKYALDDSVKLLKIEIERLKSQLDKKKEPEIFAKEWDVL
jgi:uncharacterized small protein (DUF1192 family)